MNPSSGRRSHNPVHPVMGAVRPSPRYIFPTSDGMTNQLTGLKTIAMTRASTPPMPSPVGRLRPDGQGSIGRESVEDEARVGVLGKPQQQGVERCPVIRVERRQELVLDPIDHGAEATELTLAGGGEADQVPAAVGGVPAPLDQSLLLEG